MQALAQVPADMLVSDNAHARGFRLDGYGVFFDVVVPSFTFYASAEAIPPTGARPVFCDVDPQTMCVTAQTVAAALTPRTKAVIAVHLFGNVAPIAEIAALGKSAQGGREHGAQRGFRAGSTHIQVVHQRLDEGRLLPSGCQPDKVREIDLLKTIIVRRFGFARGGFVPLDGPFRRSAAGFCCRPTRRHCAIGSVEVLRDGGCDIRQQDCAND